MFSRETQSKSLQYLLQLFLLPIAILIMVSACGDDIASPGEQLDDPRGTIQGEVFDDATGEGLSGVEVTVVEDSADADFTATATTNGDGVFTIEDIPVTADAKSIAESNGGYTNPYTIKLNASSLDGYRDNYRAEVDVVFESTGGDGAVSTDIVSRVKVPLKEQAVTVTGKAHTTQDKVIDGATVELYQKFNPVINGSSSSTANMLVASGETDSEGNFSFEGVEEDANIYFKFIDKSDPANVIDHTTSLYNTPAGDENNAQLDLGVVNASTDDQTGAFYITDISPEPGSDVGTDTEFTFTFNRPVADNAWTDASQGFDAGTFKDAIFFNDNGQKKSPGDIEFDVSWNDDRTELTVDPENLIDAHQYRLNTRAAFDNNRSGSDIGSPIHPGPVSNNDGNFVDEYDNDLSWNASEYSYYEALRLDFSTGENMEAPHTPELTLEQGNTEVNLSGTTPVGSATVTWDVDESEVPVKEYEVHISQNGGPYKHYQTIPENTDYDEVEISRNYVAETFTNGNINRIEIYNSEEGAVSTDIKIRAISDNLQHGEFSDPVTFEDVVAPEVSSAVQSGAAEVTVNFNEAMDRSDVEDASNYSFSNDDISIDSIEYNSSTQVTITVEDENNLSGGQEVTVENVTDLAGNEIDEDNNSASY